MVFPVSRSLHPWAEQAVRHGNQDRCYGSGEKHSTLPAAIPGNEKVLHKAQSAVYNAQRRHSARKDSPRQQNLYTPLLWRVPSLLLKAHLREPPRWLGLLGAAKEHADVPRFSGVTVKHRARCLLRLLEVPGAPLGLANALLALPARLVVRRPE